jgi:leader peptidase (prepilin peptidase)/N-methyltransferase
MAPVMVALLAGLGGLPAGAAANRLIDRVPARLPLLGPPPPTADAAGGASRRRPAVALATVALWFLLTLRLLSAGLGWAVPAYLLLAVVGVALAVIDATTRKLPNRLTYPAFPALAALLGLASAALGEPGRLARGLVAAAAVGALFLLLALVSPRGMGMGDVKLAPTLGLALGWLSWSAVAVGVFSAFLLGGLAGLGAMLLLRLSRKALLPFGPWLVAGALLGVLLGGEVARWYGGGAPGG